MGLLIKEEFAGDKSADQVADAVTARLGPVEDGLDLGAVGEAHRRAGGVDGELADQVAGQLTFVGGDETLEITDILERLAVEFAVGLDRQGIMEGEGLSVLTDTDLGRLAIEGAVTFPEAAHDVEALQREAGRVDPSVARSARLERAMLLQLLTDRHGPPGVRLDGGYAGGRGWRLAAEDALHDPGAADDGRSRGAVGGHLEHRGLRHETTADAAGRQRHLTQLHAFDGRELVERSETLVDEDEVGLDDGAGRQVGAQELGEGGMALVAGRVQQMVVEIIIRAPKPQNPVR